VFGLCKKECVFKTPFNEVQPQHQKNALRWHQKTNGVELPELSSKEFLGISFFLLFLFLTFYSFLLFFLLLFSWIPFLSYLFFLFSLFSFLFFVFFFFTFLIWFFSLLLFLYSFAYLY